MASGNATRKGRASMEQKKLRGFRERLVQKKQDILEAYTKNKNYGKEADEE